MNKRPDIFRDENGVPHIEADSETGLHWGLGYCHAKDRGLQMLLMRILGRGQASEFLDSNDDTLAIDKFFRRMNWSGETQRQIDLIPSQVKDNCLAYCEGINTVFGESTPWELRLLGYRPDPWKFEDSILMSRMAGYLTLAQSQSEIERLFVEMVQARVTRDKLNELFPGILGGLDEELIRKVKIHERIVPSTLVWGSVLPRMIASNNWIISGKRTASGKPILSNDPHLEVNRLPAVWSEISMKMGDRYSIGATMPGLPGVLIGRTPDLAWGATYSFMDAIDSWVEHCKDGKYLRENEWSPFKQRKEVIKRKKKDPIEVIFFENDHGVLDGDPRQEGYYLSTKWTSAQSGATSICQIMKMWNAKSVQEGMDVMAKLESAFNWVFADRHGNIGYQMSGLMPKRREGVSGFVPLAGWKKENDWQGLVSHENLPRCYNPENGYFVTANQDLSAYGRAKPINMPMGPYRADRIAALIEKGMDIQTSDIFKMHYDVHSPQAEKFMRILKPLLPDTSQGKILKDWDLGYGPESKGAFLFEKFYRALCREVFGKNGVGLDVADFLRKETGVFIDFYLNFDEVLLSEKSSWFNGDDRDTIFRRVAKESLTVAPKTWGQVQQVTLSHILLGGKLPRWLGFDRGPITIIGGRATVHQGQIYRSAKRLTSFVPSFRTVTDFAAEESLTNLAGGPSDRRFSKWYCSDLPNWVQGRYKVVSPNPKGKKLPM